MEPGSLPDDQLTYVVMGTSWKGEWIFVRHMERTTWEMPAGHIEMGESARGAAIRELWEEAGVIRSTLREVCDYSVTVDDRREFGRLYLAEVKEKVPELHHEIVELKFSVRLPERLTYPEVQSVLFERITAFYSD